MGQALGSVLTFAVGVAISPLPIIAVILMLFSARARANGVAFLVGWVTALAVVISVVYLAVSATDPASDSTADTSVSWGKATLGVLLLLLAVRQWRGRPDPGSEHEAPKWMAGIDALSPARALLLGLLLAGVNPKNLLLTIGAAAGLAQVAPTSSEAVAAIVGFVAVASITIVLPVCYYLFGGDEAKVALDKGKNWLALHNSAVMSVLFLVFGVDLVAKGMS